MPLDLASAQPDYSSTGGFNLDTSGIDQVNRDDYQDRIDAGRGMPLAPSYQPSQPTSSTGYATPQHAGVTAIRGYDPLRTTVEWTPDAQPLTEVFSPFPKAASPTQEPGEWNYLKSLGWDTLLKAGDQALGVGRMLNTAIGDMATQKGGGNEWVEQHLAGWHDAIQSEIADNIKQMGEGHRAAYEGSILRSLGVIGPTDDQGNPIHGVFEGGGGVGRFANWAAAQVTSLIPAAVAGLVTGGAGAIAMLSAQTMGDQYNATADQIGKTDDTTYQSTNPIYRDLRQNQGMTEMQAKQEMLQHAMLAAMASGAITGAAGAAGMRGAPSTWGPILRRVWGAVTGGAAFGAGGAASSATEQKLMTGDVDVTTAMREALTQGAQGVGMGLIFGAHPRGRPGEEKPPGAPDAGTKGVDADTAAAAAAARPEYTPENDPRQTQMFTPQQTGPTVASSPTPTPGEPTRTAPPPGTAPIATDRTPGPYAPQTYPGYGPQGPTVVSRPEGMPQARQPDLLGGAEQGPSGPINPPPAGGAAARPAGPGPAPRTPTPELPPVAPPAAEAAAATSKGRGRGKVTPEVTPTGTTTGLENLGGAAQAIGENLRDMLWQRHQAGEITEPGNIPSNLLQGAKWLKDQGVVTDRPSFNEFVDAYGAAGGQVRSRDGFNKFLGDYAQENRPGAEGEAPAPAAEPSTIHGQTVVQRDSGDRYTVTHGDGSRIAVLTKEGEGPRTTVTLNAQDLAAQLDKPGSAWSRAGAAASAEPKLTPFQMRQQLIEWGYKRSQVKTMRVADVQSAHAKGPEGAPAKAAEAAVRAAEKEPPAAKPVAVTEPERSPEPQPGEQVTSQGDVGYVREAEAERVPPEQREMFPAQPKEEAPPIAEPVSGRAAEKARMAAGREIPVKGEAAVAEHEPETVQVGAHELEAPEDPVEARREALHEQVQSHAEQVIQPKGKADIKAAVNRATKYLHDLIDQTDGTPEAVAERMDASIKSLPEGNMPGTTTSWRNYLTQMMTRLTGHEPEGAAERVAEIEQVQREEQAPKATATPKVSGEAIEERIAAPAQGELGGMEPVARKAEADTVTSVKRKAENLIKRMRDGDLTPAEAAAEYDKPVQGETRGTKRSKGYGTFREVLQTKLVQAADENAERRILDEINRVQNNRELSKPKRDGMVRKLANDLKNVGRVAASELQDWLERIDDPARKGIEDDVTKHGMPAGWDRVEPSVEGIGPRAARVVQSARDPRVNQNLYQRMIQHMVDHGFIRSSHVLGMIRADPMLRAEVPYFQRLATQLQRLIGQRDVPIYDHNDAYLRGKITENEHAGFEGGDAPAMYYRYNNAPERDFIVANMHRVHQDHGLASVMMHEIGHTVGSRLIDHMIEADPHNPMLNALRLIGDELQKHFNAERDVNQYEEVHIPYAIDDPHELHTMALSDPTLQAYMASFVPSREFVAAMRAEGYDLKTPGRSLWAHFINLLRRAFGLEAPRSAADYTLLDHVFKPITDIAEAGNRYNERLLPKDPALSEPAKDSYRALGYAIGPTARDTMDRVSRTIDYGRLSDAKRGVLMRATPLDRLVERFGNAIPGIHTFRTANEMIRFAGKDFSDRHADDIKTVARRITSADDRPGLQSLMNEATLNEMALHPGGDNAHLAPEQQGLLRELKDRYNSLSAKDKETYNLTTDLHDKMYQEVRDARIRSMVNIYMPDADEKTADAFVKAARTREGLDRYVDNTDDAHRDIVKAIADFHKLGYVQGDYFPLRRFGNYVVRYGDRDDLNNYGVEFFESRSKAEVRRKELLAQGVPDTYRVDAKDAYRTNELAPGHATVDTLIDRLAKSGLDEEQQNLVKEQLNRIMVQQATRSARSRLQQTYRRRGIRGASEDQARALSSDFISNSQAIGHLLWGPARARALGEMRRNVDDLSKPGAPDSSLDPVTGRTVVAEMARRSNRLDDPDNVVHKVLRGINLFNYLHSLDSLSHMVSSTMEAHTNSVALGGARYGYGRFSLNLTKALMQLTPKMAATGAMNTLKGVGSELKATDWNLAHIARDRLIKGGANADHMNRLFDAAEKAGLIDHTIMTDLRMDAAGLTGIRRLAGEGLNRFMILTQAGAHATDVMNKSAIMKAAFDSHMTKFPGDVDGAIAAGMEYGRKSMPNYNMANRGSIDRYLGPLLQFKRYGIHMYSLIGNLAREMAHGDHKFEAAKALTGLALTHAMMAGAITTIADPLRYFMGAYDLITTGKAKDHQAAVRGWLSDTFGQQLGEIIGRGVPHVLGVDMRHRVGLENLLELPELDGLDKDSIGKFLLGLTTGATGESMIDQGVAAGKLIHGDIGGFLKGVVPRLLRDPMKAFDLAEKGVTDSKGKTVLPASRLSAGDVAAQALGFQPATVSEFREGRNAVLQQREELTSEHSRLEQKYLNASPAERSSVLQEIHEFNADPTTKRWGGQLTMDQLMKAQAAGKKADRAPFGLRIPAKAVQGARYAGRFANIGSPIPAAAGP